MKAVINNKLYNTETAEKIFSYLKNIPETRYFLRQEYQTNCWRDTDIYKTKKENYFIHIKQPNNDKNNNICGNKEEVIKIISKEEIIRILQKLDIEKAIELFGEIEEG